MKKQGALVTATVLAAAGLALGTPTAHAAAQQGTWLSPQPGATVSGIATLTFATQQANAAFLLPYGRFPANAASGQVSGTFDTTGLPDGPVTIAAQECDSTGCTSVVDNVVVDNTSQSALSVSPKGGTVAPGSSITFGGAGTASVTMNMDGKAATRAVTLPYVYTLPVLTEGTHGFSAAVSQGASNVYGSYATVVPDTPPSVSSLSAPRFFVAAKTGFGVKLVPNKPVKATLVIVKGRKTVAYKVANLSTRGGTLVTGKGLRPGNYGWYVVLADDDGQGYTTRALGLKAK